MCGDKTVHLTPSSLICAPLSTSWWRLGLNSTTASARSTLPIGGGDAPFGRVDLHPGGCSTTAHVNGPFAPVNEGDGSRVVFRLARGGHLEGGLVVGDHIGICGDMWSGEGNVVTAESMEGGGVMYRVEGAVQYADKGRTTHFADWFWVSVRRLRGLENVSMGALRAAKMSIDVTVEEWGKEGGAMVVWSPRQRTL
jgi:hypothetical protein